eukprot:5751195-Alexandrium_andersonii.AAC.2
MKRRLMSDSDLEGPPQSPPPPQKQPCCAPCVEVQAMWLERLESMKQLGVPRCITDKVPSFWRPGHESVVLVECFCGVASIAFGFGCFGLKSQRLDKDVDPEMDLCLHSGLAYLLASICRLVKGG